MANSSGSTPLVSLATLPVGDTLVSDIPKLDLESYIQTYSGRTLIERLYFVGTHSTVLCVDALRLAVREAKKGKDVRLWMTIVNRLGADAPDDPAAQPDEKWRNATNIRNGAESERLEAELKGYKNNLIKESIRLGLEDLGKHYHAMGDFKGAYDAFGRMRAEISVQKQMVDIAKHLISVSYDDHNWVSVHSNVSKLGGIKSLTPEEQRLNQPFASVPSGIAYLSTNRYYEAALALISTEPGVGKELSHICSPNDIAVYGGLCGLATMSRGQLQTQVLESPNFRTYLELEPHIRRAIAFFITGRYAACLSILESYKTDYLLDIHLAHHVSELYYLIRSKSIVQYFIPFSCVTLQSLEEAFGTDVKQSDNELVRMIKEGALVARIDTQKELLTSVPEDARYNVQSSTLTTSKTYEKEMKRRLARMNILGAGYQVIAGQSSETNNYDWATGLGPDNNPKNTVSGSARNGTTGHFASFGRLLG